MSETIDIDVVFALPTGFWRRNIRVPSGTTATQALRQSGLDEVFAAETGEAPDTLGVFGRKVGPDHVMQPGERLELYRGLVANPRQRRRERARSR